MCANVGWNDNKSEYVEDFNEFLEAHSFCDDNEHKDFEPSNETGFYLAYEHPSDKSDIQHYQSCEKNMDSYNKRVFDS